MPESTGTGGQSGDSGQHDPIRDGTIPMRHPHHGPGPMAAIALGGALGTLARYVIERGFVSSPAGLPWATLSVNVLGSFVLGVVVTLVVERWPTDRYLRPLVAVGFCGGFTTFSTLAVEIDRRIQHGHIGVAAAYLALSLVAGLGAALAGITLAGGRLHPSLTDASIPDPDLLAGDEGRL